MKRFKETIMVTAVIALMILAVNSADAQSIKKHYTPKNNRFDLMQSEKDLADDKADFKRLKRLVNKLERAQLNHERRNYEVISRRIAKELKSDLKETAIQVRQAEREIDDTRYGMFPRGNKKQIKKALKDDIKDFKKAEKILNQKREIAAKVKKLQRKFANNRRHSGNLQNRQINLLHNYLDLSKKEIVLDKQEVKEDRAEMRRFKTKHREFGYNGF